MQTKAKKNNWQKFIKICLKSKTKQQLISIFDLFLTKAEQEDISARFEIISELLVGKMSQREIAKKCNISLAKITRGSNALRVADEATKNLIRCSVSR